MLFVTKSGEAFILELFRINSERIFVFYTFQNILKKKLFLSQIYVVVKNLPHKDGDWSSFRNSVYLEYRT
jgi:hypothetical protein